MNTSKIVITSYWVLQGGGVEQPVGIAAGLHLAMVAVAPEAVVLFHPKLEPKQRPPASNLFAYSRPAVILLAGLLIAWRFRSQRHVIPQACKSRDAVYPEGQSCRIAFDCLFAHYKTSSDL